METGLTLTGDMMLVLAVLVITIALFVFEVVRVDVVALSVMVLLGLLGLVPSEMGFENHKPSRWSAGVDFDFVPVRNLEVLKRVMTMVFPSSRCAKASSSTMART